MSVRDARLFASAADDPLGRRPTDVALVLGSTILLLLVAPASRIGSELDRGLTDLLTSFPDVLDVAWKLSIGLLVGWALTLVSAASLSRRTRLVIGTVAALGIATAVGCLVGRVGTEGPWRGLQDIRDWDGPPVLPPMLLTLAVAVVATVSPHLTVPFRHLGRWLILGAAVGAMFLGGTRASGAVVAIAIGTLTAAVTHLLAGSPGGRPSPARIEAAVRDLGITARSLSPSRMASQGAVFFEGRDADGPLTVKVYGRDAWDGQLLATLWHAAWYRGSRRTARLSRIELVEHEGFMTMLAERNGLAVPTLCAAGTAGHGDALVVLRPRGEVLASSEDPVPTSGIDGLWAELTLLHARGMCHQWIDLDRVDRREDGSIGFCDLSTATLGGDRGEVERDVAQALALTVVVVGEEVAVPAARRAVGDDVVESALPYLQDAAMPTLVRDELQARKVKLDEVRLRIGEALGNEQPPLIRLRRVTVGSLVNMALLAVAATTLVGLVAGLDLDAFLDELRHASWWWLAFALLLAQLPRVPAALSTMGSLREPVPFGPLVVLQLALCYVNLAIPSTVARVAINVRFFQRCGVPPTAAISAGAIDSISGFVVQIALFVAVFSLADVDVAPSLDLSGLDGLSTVVLVVLALLVVGAGASLLVPAVRRRVTTVVHQAGEAVRVLRAPRKLAQLFGGNLLSQVGFAIALAACVHALGGDISLGRAILINTAVSLFAGLLPVPGGIGVSEAGLTLGLTSAGIPAETAAAAAVAYRFVSFYLPPIWGFPSYRWLVGQRFL